MTTAAVSSSGKKHPLLKEEKEGQLRTQAREAAKSVRGISSSCPSVSGLTETCKNIIAENERLRIEAYRNGDNSKKRFQFPDAKQLSSCLDRIGMPLETKEPGPLRKALEKAEMDVNELEFLMFLHLPYNEANPSYRLEEWARQIAHSCGIATTPDAQADVTRWELGPTDKRVEQMQVRARELQAEAAKKLREEFDPDYQPQSSAPKKETGISVPLPPNTNVYPIPKAIHNPLGQL